VSLGTWQPTPNEQSLELSCALFAPLLTSSNPLPETLEHLGEGPFDIYKQATLVGSKQWLDFAETLTSEQRLRLIRAYTLLEQIPTWQLGNNSPVISLFKVHKRLAGGIDQTLIQWIKDHTENRFLPFGSLT
jgi:hypothetical protein